MDDNPVSPHNTPALGIGGAWAMAVGGMIGGGIFSTLGVVISVAGQWAWLSFLVGGVIALASGQSYSALTRQIGEPGGSYTYLRALNWNRTARAVAWLLILGYTLTVAVYAVTFGAYAAHALGYDGATASLCGIAAIMLLAGVNLLGALESSVLEQVAVWGKLAILFGLALIGLWHWAPDRLLLDTGHSTSWHGALLGTGVVFMAYEGFQLLSYDYDEMRHPARTITVAMPLAIVVTAIAYILVSLSAGMLAGAPAIVHEKEVALALAGRAALGEPGFYLVSLAAVFSASSAINATVFSTARLAEKAARDGELPAVFARRRARDVTWVGTLLISGLAIVLVLVGGIESLVEGGSFVFLLVFALVNALAIIRRAGSRLVAGFGLAGSLTAAAILVHHLLGIV